jgi:hypothetical protein
MRPPSSIRRALASGLAALLCLPLTALPASADAAGGHRDGIRLEHLDRGLVAASTSEGTFLSWRLLGDEVTGAGATGMTGADFRVYRDGRPIATVTDSTNYRDPAGTAASEYR